MPASRGANPRPAARGPSCAALAGHLVLSLLAAFTFAAQSRAAARASTEEIVSRSDIFVGQPNILPTQAMPLGNGRLGIAIWAANGLTLQLNRADTLPGRLSPGQVVFEGLKPMIADRDFRGRLELFNGVWRQTGAGMSAQVSVDQHVDRVIVDVSGADPNLEQTVSLNLWQPRSPAAAVHDDIVLLAEHWLDNTLPGASGLPFGSLAGIRVLGRNVTGRKVDDRTVAVTFHSTADGHYRVIIAAPSFDGGSDPVPLLLNTLDAPLDLAASRHWWNELWKRACLIRATSSDGRADYFESLRMLYLFFAAAEGRGPLPGSQAGIAALLSAAKDVHFWDPAAFWQWNLRMQVAANLRAGVPELNEPYFALYRDNLGAIRRWTLAKMGGRAGICVPETMRFNGVGIEYESAQLRPFAIITHSCDLGWPAVANARTLSTGAEVGMWVWESYLETGDLRFLRTNYPLMAEAARFLLAYQRPGADGLLHTSPSNAHETQSDVTDPTTDLSAIRSLYPATIAAAKILSRDTELAAALAAALGKTPALPLTSVKGAPGNVIAASYKPTAAFLNAENIGLEPVWPYSLIDPDSPLFDVAVRTYEHRPFRDLATWSNDPIHAARLGLGSEMARSLYSLTQLYQVYPNGMADLLGNSGEFYIEQLGVVAVALAEALAQDHADVIRIGPAIPPNWTLNGTVRVRGNARITVDVNDGEISGFELQAGSTQTFRIANPWSPKEVIVLHAEAGRTYPFEPPAGRANPDRIEFRASADAPKTLGRASIGLGETCCAPPPGYDPSTDFANRESR